MVGYTVIFEYKRTENSVWNGLVSQGLTVSLLLKGHSGFESGFFRALSAFGSSPYDTMHTN